jgi:hypothetical protein
MTEDFRTEKDVLHTMVLYSLVFCLKITFKIRYLNMIKNVSMKVLTYEYKHVLHELFHQ